MQLELKGNRSNPNATDEEKVAAKAKVDEAVNNAKSVNRPTTNNAGVTLRNKWRRFN